MTGRLTHEDKLAIQRRSLIEKKVRTAFREFLPEDKHGTVFASFMHPHELPGGKGSGLRLELRVPPERHRDFFSLLDRADLPWGLSFDRPGAGTVCTDMESPPLPGKPYIFHILAEDRKGVAEAYNDMLAELVRSGLETKLPPERLRLRESDLGQGATFGRA